MDIREEMLLRALSMDYGSVYLVDFVKDEVTPYRLYDYIEENFGDILRAKPKYAEVMKIYIDNTVAEGERDKMLQETTVERIREVLTTQEAFSYDFHAIRDGKSIYCRMKVAKLDDDPQLHMAVIGFSNISTTKQRELESYAYVDVLTRGNNYVKYKELVKNTEGNGFFVSMDIHNFKLVNTFCGAVKGDLALKEIWNCIAKNIESSDFAGHINGDHFVIFFSGDEPDVVVKKIINIKEAIVDMCKKLDIPIIHPYFGISRWQPGMTTEIALTEAYEAKSIAKGNRDVCYSFYTERDHQRIWEETVMIDGFEPSIKKNRFEVWFQPKYSPERKELVGAEALVRWRKKDGEIVPPGKFIPLFEKNGMIRILDEYVFRRVCEQQKKWMEEGLSIVPVSTNLSRASLHFCDVVRHYKEITEEIGIDPRWVPIEITEGAAIESEIIMDLANEFAAAGFSLHMDDFGSGYSSLASLNLLRFDTLKIDKSLIDYIGNYGGDRLLLHTICLAKELGLHVTAEGVETSKQVAFLKRLNCDSIQGFFYSKPLPKDDFVEELNSNIHSSKMAAVRELALSKREACDLQNKLEEIIGNYIEKSELKNIVTNMFVINNYVYLDVENITRMINSIFDYANSNCKSTDTIVIAIRQNPNIQADYAFYEIKIFVPNFDVRDENMFENDSVLAEAIDVIKHMGGSIVAVEEKGGISFVIKIAFKLQQKTKYNMRDTENVIAKKLHEISDNKIILLAEDNELNRVFTKEILQDGGFIVETAIDGKDAVNAIKKHPENYYSIVLMDIVMPNKDGYETTIEIRQLDMEYTKTLPVIALSSNAMNIDKKKAQESGINGHIAKPLDIREVIKLLEE